MGADSMTQTNSFWRRDFCYLSPAPHPGRNLLYEVFPRDFW
jgi:hypothetical protein